MTQTSQSPEQASASPRRSGWFWLFAVTSPFLFCCLLSNCGGILQPPLMVFLGWIGFLYRVVPQMTVDWAGVGMAVVCVGLLVGVFQFLGRTTAPSSAGSMWSWKKSVLLASAVVVMFWAGLSAVGFMSAVQRFCTLNVWGSSSIRIAASRTQSQYNLKQMALAVHGHHDEHTHLPVGATFDAHGRALHGWETSLLPYLEYEALYKTIRRDLPWRHPANRAAFAKEVLVFRSPFLEKSESHADGWALTHYAGNMHLLGGRKMRLQDILDGGDTLLIGETAAGFTPWGKPFNVRDPGVGINRAPDGFGNPSSTVKGANFAFTDGSVRFLGEDISPRVLKALATPAGGEVVRDDEW